ncbi:MAG: hypothetical protein QF507_03000, partial [Vicinamibacterales bacterium]|nr:hypothetical protein [Vicinamibacterales bacterium]
MTRNLQEKLRVIVLLAGLAAILGASALYISMRLEITVDLTYFLPEPQTLGQQLLTKRLGQGPGSRLIFVSLEKGPDGTGLDNLVNINDELNASGLFTFIRDGAPELS